MKTKEKVHTLRDQGLTVPEICKELNVGKGTVGFHLKTHQGEKRKKKNKTRIIPKRNKINIQELIKDYKILTLEKINDKYQISNHLIYKILRENGVEIKKRKKKEFYKKVLKGEIIVKNPYYSSINGILKRIIIKENLLEYKCNKCGINEWNGEKLILDLEHKNGDRSCNILKNLSFLCPNCHSQTPTYKGKIKNK